MVAVVASTIVPLTIVCLIGNGVVLFRGFEDAVSAFLCGTVGILGNIAFIAFIAVCCGTVGHSIVTYILISGAYPICVLVLTLYPQMVLPGMSGFSNFGEFPVSPVVLSLLSPFIAPICAYGSGLIENVLNALISSSTISTGTTVSVFYYVWWIVFTAGLVVATYFLVKKRKSESAQSGFAFVFPSVAIKFFTSVTAGLLMGLILASVSTIPYSTDGSGSVAFIILFCVGIIVGTIISHIILHLIYHKGMSGFGKWMILYGCEALVSLIFFAIVTTGMFGYVTRVPDVEDVKSVEITFSSCVDPEIKIKGKNPQIYSTSDPESIKSIVEYHSAVVQEYEKQCSGIYTPVGNYGNDEEYENYNGDGLYLRYTDKKGNQITRAYSNPSLVFKHTRIIGDIIGSIDSGDGIVGKAPIDRCSELDMYIEGWKGFKDGNYTIKDKNVIKKLIENYNKDIDNLGLLSADNVFEEDTVSYYGIDCNIYYTTDDGDDMGYMETMYVSKQHKNTIKYLKSIDLEKYYQDFDDSDYYD